MTLTNLNFALFDVNIQCLMRQEIQSSKMVYYYYYYYYYYYICQGIHPTSLPASPKTLKNIQSGSYIIPHKLYFNVLVIV
jgi:hypothetical protein